MLELLLILIILLVLLGAFFYVRGRFLQKRSTSEKQEATILLEQIRLVCKLVTVEGRFSEILTHKSSKKLLGLLPSNKQALVIVKATAYVGFDLGEVQLDSIPEEKIVRILRLPEPQIQSIETDLTYYDITESAFNKFTPEELTVLNADAKKHIREVVGQSDLMTHARDQGLRLLNSMNEIAHLSGWTFEFPDITGSIAEMPRRHIGPSEMNDRS